MTEEKDRLTLLSLDMEKETDGDALKANETYKLLKDYIHYRRCTADRNRHVVIIGGGIIGLMSAFYMRKQGFHVTIIEKKSFGAGASGRNGGGVLAMGRELAEIPFARLSIELWGSLSPVDMKFCQRGHLMIACNDYERQKLERAAELYTLSGLDIKLCSKKQVQGVLPDVCTQISGGIFSPVDSQSYPFTTITGLQKVLKQNGVALLSHTEVIGFETDGSYIKHVVTSKGNIKGDIFVVSAGPWTGEITEWMKEEIKIQPRRSQIMVTEIVKEKKIGPFVSGNGLYLKQTHAGNLLYGGGGGWEQTGFDVSNTTFAIQLLTKRFLELFPGYRTKQLLRAFAGTVEITPDHLPYFGRLEAYDNAYISAGYNGHGYGMSAIMGKLLSCLAADHDDDSIHVDDVTSILSFVSPKRFQTEKASGGTVYE
ncbi:NAD(P)/FAD-dependent oxidoreductase [Bacillus songklensis]|uniref:NAD(P)/FAD-dependent oxidoreductase n=1 Tax=Bacillus songklensis TaxID=1069116 RepID=A0ABV8B683_9BACI